LRMADSRLRVGVTQKNRVSGLKTGPQAPPGNQGTPDQRIPEPKVGGSNPPGRDLSDARIH
jgi:hypothetical protein